MGKGEEAQGIEFPMHVEGSVTGGSWMEDGWTELIKGSVRLEKMQGNSGEERTQGVTIGVVYVY